MLVPDDYAEAKRLLMPRLYGSARVVLDGFELGLSGRQSGLEVVVAAAPGVSVGVVVDMGDGEVRVSQAMLDTWRVGFDEVLDAALAVSDNRPVKVSRVAPEVVLVEDPVFAASVWLKPSLVDVLGISAPVVVAPTRGWTLVAGNTAASLTVLAVIVSGLLEEGQDVESVTASVFGSDGWREVPWDRCGVEESLQRKVTRLFAERLYGRQKPLLEADLARRGEDVFVASYKVFKAPDGKIVSSATWPQGVETLLPVVDQIQVVDNSLQRTACAWDTALPRLVACSLVPERYRTLAS